MKILLDECVDWRLSRDLQEHEVKTARQMGWATVKMGWATVKNGELLALASETFDVFVTVDRKLPSQQNLNALAIAVVVLRAAHQSTGGPPTARARFAGRPPSRETG